MEYEITKGGAYSVKGNIIGVVVGNKASESSGTRNIS